MSETKKPTSQNFPYKVSVVLRWAKPKNHRAKIPHKKYRWFCGERNQTTTEPKFSIKSIGDFAVSDTEKRPQRKKKVLVVLPLTKPINDSKNSIGGFSVTSTDNSHRWFRRLLPVRYDGEKTHRWFFNDYLGWFTLLGWLHNPLLWVEKRNGSKKI